MNRAIVFTYQDNVFKRSRISIRLIRPSFVQRINMLLPPTTFKRIIVGIVIIFDCVLTAV